MRSAKSALTLAALVIVAGLFTIHLYAIAAPSQAGQALQITDGPRVEGVGNTWAVIAWTTSTGGSTIVRYGTDANNLSQTAEAPWTKAAGGGHTTHRVHVNGLKPGTTYYFIVDSGEGSGTGTEVKSNVASFTTKGGSGGSGEENDSAQERQPVKITDGPRVEGVGNMWAVVAWTTNAASSTVVRYGTDPNNLNQMAQAPYTDVEGASKQTHRVHINNLKPNTTYYFIVDSGQGEGTGTEAKSAVAQFKTK